MQPGSLSRRRLPTSEKTLHFRVQEIFTANFIDYAQVLEYDTAVSKFFQSVLFFTGAVSGTRSFWALWRDLRWVSSARWECENGDEFIRAGAWSRACRLIVNSPCNQGNLIECAVSPAIFFLRTRMISRTAYKPCSGKSRTVALITSA
jgi:hypothetical protein